jgi:hypothetical protein
MARMRLTVGLVGLGLLLACEEQARPAAKRAELRQIGGDRVELVPAAGQLPYCLVFTRSETGVLRQLTMTHENRSVRCNAGEPVGRVSYRIPVEEGAVEAMVFFSDQKLHAGSVSQQLYELPAGQRITPINLRLPGQVFVESLTFRPGRDSEVTVGAVVGPAGQLQPAAPGTAQHAAHQQGATPPPAAAQSAGTPGGGAVQPPGAVTTDGTP